ncbi:MAG: hypothetical protein AAF206_26190, partial [Bacteroidota bacterium]
MKIYFHFCLIFLFSPGLHAQQAQEVVSIARMMHDYDWYARQSQLWQQKVRQNPQNAHAWLNYYEANRQARNVNQGKAPVDPGSILTEMGKAIPETYEFHYLTYRHHGGDVSKFPSLQKAWDLKPGEPKLLDEFVTHYELKRDLTQRKVYNEKWYQANDLPAENLAYNYNVLMSLRPNAILITNGDMDTYPIWMLQDALNIRTDVLVINRSLIMSPEYADKIFSQEKMPVLISDKRTFPEIISHFQTHSNRPIFFGLTVSQATTDRYKDQLYVVGLASLLSEKRIDNEKTLATNFEKRFQTEYLLTPLQHIPEKATSRLLTASYLTPLLMLNRYYEEKGQSLKQKAVRKL